MKKKFLVRPGFIIPVVLTFAVVLIAVTVIDIYSSYRDIYLSKSEEAISLLRAVQKSGENAFLSSIEVENLIEDRLVTSAFLLSKLEEERKLNSSELNKISEANNIDHIYLFSSSDYPELLNTNREYSELDIYHKYSNEIGLITSGRYDYFIAGSTPDTKNSSHLLILHKRNSKAKGLIALSVESGYILDFRKKIGVGRLFQKIAEGKDIEYIVIQDSAGIITASQGVENLSTIEADRFLSASIKERKISSREIDFNGKKIFEAVKPFRMDGEITGIIRIGMSLEPIKHLVSRTILRSVIISFLLLLIGTTIIIYISNSESYYEEARKRQEKLSAMGELAGGVAHEIKNPLNMIGISAQRLNMEFTPREDKEEYAGLIKNIMNEVFKVKDIIDQFLKFSKPQKVRKEKVNLKDLVENISSSYKSKSLKEGIRFTSRCDDGEAYLDLLQMRQAINNLLDNAFDAVGETGSVCLEAVKNPNNIIIKVTDDGSGISREDMDKIFNIYYTTKPHGTGLGLSIVNQIVTEHGGVITVDSSLGKGTLFTIEVPTE